MRHFRQTALFALGLAALLGESQTTLAQIEAGQIPPPDVGKDKHRHGRLDSILNDVVAAYERNLDAALKKESAAAGKAAARALSQKAASRMAARRAPLSEGESVAVTLRIEDASKIKAVTRFLRDNGGDPRNVGEDYIEAYVPVTLLVEASKQPGVFRVQAIVPPQPKRGPITSQGVQAHGASLWHALGVTGKDVKVGVIDTGFSGFRGLMGSELPASVAARCYISMGEPTSDLSNCENEGDVHGTAVAEALLDIAPDVSLYIADPESKGDLAKTVDWMAEQGVQVINYSASWPWDGPGDGTSPYRESPLKTVDAAVGKGVVWVNAAGNEGQSAWSGFFQDSDGDGVHEFHGNYEWNCFTVMRAEKIQLQLRWEGQWKADAPLADLDLYLYRLYENGLGADLVEESEEFQNDIDAEQSGTRNPSEHLLHNANYGESFCAQIERYVGYGFRTPDPGWIQLIVLTSEELQFPTFGSIGNPAESANPGMLAVGAAPWSDITTIEGYSSRGPTPDNRIKPDIVGVDMAHSLSYQTLDPSGAFPGTSQASPHVAGLAALVRDAYPRYSPRQVADYLKFNAEPRRILDLYYNRHLYRNNVWGYGLARLPPITVGYREAIQSDDGSRRVPLSRYFPTANVFTTYTAASSNPELLAVSIRQGVLVASPAQDGEGQATITITATFRDGLRATVRIAMTVERALMRSSFLSGWRIGLLELPVSTTTPSAKPFKDASTEK